MSYSVKHLCIGRALAESYTKILRISRK